MQPESIDLITAVIGFVFTIAILSYAVGDNPFFRTAVYIFIGVSAGYVSYIIIQQVIYGMLLAPLIYGSDLLQKFLLVPALIMSLFLLSKLSPQTQWLGRWVVAYLAGVGTAAMVSGAVMGTLLPQTWAAMNSLAVPFSDPNIAVKLVSGLFTLIGTVTTLAYFQFSQPQTQPKAKDARYQLMRIINGVGEVFFAITFAALFVGVFSASLTALVDRSSAIVQLFASFFSG